MDKVIDHIGIYLENRFSVQYQGGTGFQTAGILKYADDWKGEHNAGIGPKDFLKWVPVLVDQWTAMLIRLLRREEL